MAKQQAAAQAGASVRPLPPAAILAAIAGALLLLDAAHWLAEANATAVSQTVSTCLLLASAIAVLGAARVVREALRWAALLCAAAIVVVTVLHLVLWRVYLNPRMSFPPADLDYFTPSLFTWLAIVTPLALSIVLALRQPRSPREPAR